jgi:hypothetical protein
MDVDHNIFSVRPLPSCSRRDLAMLPQGRNFIRPGQHHHVTSPDDVTGSRRSGRQHQRYSEGPWRSATPSGPSTVVAGGSNHRIGRLSWSLACLEDLENGNDCDYDCSGFPSTLTAAPTASLTETDNENVKDANKYRSISRRTALYN